MMPASETAPLLTRESSYESLNTLSQCGSTDLPSSATRRQPRGVRFEIIYIFKNSIPVILSYILQNSIQTVSVLVVGRLGPDELSVAAFSLMLAFVTGWSVALGGTTALDTLGSQAFTGGKNSTDLSIHLQRCLLLLLILFLPVAIAWIHMEPILLVLGQDERLAFDTQSYLKVLLAGAPGYIAFESLKKYLQCQGIMTAATLALIVVSPINLALNMVLVHHTDLRLLGSPAALSITYWLAFGILAVYTAYSPSHRENKTWGGLQLRAVIDMKSCIVFLKLALPGILMVGSEWAAFETVALAAGRLGPISLSAQSVIMTTDQILNTIPFGIGVAASTRVGNLIGQRSAEGARSAGHVSALLSIIAGFVVMIILLSIKDIYGYIFTNDENVVSLVSKVMPLVASFQIADGLAGSCGGVLRGQGRQHLGALFNIMAYYVLALPFGIYLAFRTNLGLQGLWIGQVVALFIVGLGEYAVVSLGTNWEKEIEKAMKRNGQVP